MRRLGDKRPRVLYVIDTLAVGGTERSMVEIVRRLSLTEAAVVTLFGDEPLGAELRGAGVVVVNLGMPTRSLGRATAALERYIARTLPDVIHSHLFRADVVARNALRFARIPLVNTFVNDSYGLVRWRASSLLPAVSLARVLLLDRATAPRVDVFTSNSGTVADSNATALGIDRRTVRVIHRGRDLVRFRASSPSERARLRSELGWSDSRFFVVNVARLISRKNQALLIDALSKGDVPANVDLVLVGDGPDRSLLMAQARRLGVIDRVHFLGTRTDVPEILCAADVFAFPSAYEGFPGALVEAMASQKPIIASDIPVHRETLGSGDGAIFVDGDANAWARALRHLVSDSALASSLAERAFAASSNYGIGAVAAAHDELYVELAGRRR